MTEHASDSDLLRPVSRVGKIMYGFIRLLGLAVGKLLWRLDVQGQERIPSVGPFVLAPVHRSYVDFLIACIVTPRRMRYMGKSSLWGAPKAFQKFIEMLGAFPVDREGVDREALRVAEGLLEMGEPLVMFPEGRRKEGPVVEDLFSGPGWIACRQRVPIIPVAIGGSEEAMPLGKKMVHFARVRVVIGEPIYPDVPLEGRIPRRAISEVTAELEKNLQELYDGVR